MTRRYSSLIYSRYLDILLLMSYLLLSSIRPSKTSVIVFANTTVAMSNRCAEQGSSGVQQIVCSQPRRPRKTISVHSFSPYVYLPLLPPPLREKFNRRLKRQTRTQPQQR